MTITVNGADREVAADTTLADVVASLTGASTGVAVALDDTVVARGSWSGTVLRAGSRVEVLTAVPGG